MPDVLIASDLKICQMFRVSYICSPNYDLESSEFKIFRFTVLSMISYFKMFHNYSCLQVFRSSRLQMLHTLCFLLLLIASHCYFFVFANCMLSVFAEIQILFDVFQFPQLSYFKNIRIIWITNVLD